MKTKHKRKRPIKIVVTLTGSDITCLRRMLHRGKRKAREMIRARILLMSHQGKTNREIIDALECSSFAIGNIRSRYVKRGKDVMKTIVDAPRPGQPKKILPAHEAFVVATACSDAPHAHAHWTLDALRQKLLGTYTDMKSVSHERIRQILIRNKLKPWREKNVVRPKTHSHLS